MNIHILMHESFEAPGAILDWARKHDHKVSHTRFSLNDKLPINIKVVGGYHDLATFVSGVASLPRIVTLHDFEIKTEKNEATSKLRMNIVAKTYRYNDKGLQK